MIFNNNLHKENIAIITDTGDRFTYNDLKVMSEQLMPHICRGSLVFNLCRNAIGSIIGYLAFLNSHTPAVMLDGNKDKDTIKNLISIYKPKYLWLPSDRVRDFCGEVKAELKGYSLMELNYDICNLHPDISLLLTTSGSTGSPKLVKLTTKNLLSNAESIADYLDIQHTERAITSLPIYYSYGLSVINSHFIKGATILLTDKSVMQKEFWSFAKENSVTSISGVPYTYEMLRRLRIFNMGLDSLKTMTQAGGKLNPNLVKEFVEKAQADGKRFIVMYGQTEATARMSYTPAEKALEKYSSIGIAIPGGHFSIIDTNGNEITDCNIDGELIYRGENVSMGYAECIEDLKKRDENNGVLHTGDIAHMDSDGFYYITGRLKRFVKIWGNRCNLDAVEQLVKELTTDCACVGVDDKITIFVTNANLEQKIKEYLADKTGLNIRAFEVKQIMNIPKNVSGKVQYAELNKLLD